MADQPEALRLADGLQHQAAWERHYGPSHLLDFLLQAAAELRRLHEVNQELLETLQDLCDTLGECGMTERARAIEAKLKEKNNG